MGEQQQSSWQEELLLEYGINTDEASSSSSGLLWNALFIGNDHKIDGLRKEHPENFHLSMELTKIEMKYRNAQHLSEKQEQDQQLEDEISLKVKERKEPARDIAKRQKKEKEMYRNQQHQQEMIITDATETEVATPTGNDNNDGDDIEDTDMMEVDNNDTIPTKQ